MRPPGPGKPENQRPEHLHAKRGKDLARMEPVAAGQVAAMEVGPPKPMSHPS